MIVGGALAEGPEPPRGVYLLFPHLTPSIDFWESLIVPILQKSRGTKGIVQITCPNKLHYYGCNSQGICDAWALGRHFLSMVYHSHSSPKMGGIIAVLQRRKLRVRGHPIRLRLEFGAQGQKLFLCCTTCKSLFSTWIFVLINWVLGKKAGRS